MPDGAPSRKDEVYGSLTELGLHRQTVSGWVAVEAAGGGEAYERPFQPLIDSIALFTCVMIPSEG